jgi:hypothetical protein
MDEKKLAVAEGVKALLAEYAIHVLHVEQQLAREGLAENREQFHCRKQDTRRKIIIGGAVLAEAKTNPEFAKELYSLLSRRVTDPRDWALIVPPQFKAVPPPLTAPSLPSEAAFTAEAERRLAATPGGERQP